LKSLLKQYNKHNSQEEKYRKLIEDIVGDDEYFEQQFFKMIVKVVSDSEYIDTTSEE